VHFCIFQTWGLGDLIMTTPVISEYRNLYPKGKLTLVVRGKSQAALMAGSDLVDEIVVMPSSSEKSKLLEFFFRLRQHQIDAAFIATRLSPLLTIPLRYISGIPTIIGDGDESMKRLAGLYTVRNNIDPSVHRVDRMLETFSMWSGRPARPASFPVNVDPDAHREALRILSELNLQPGNFVVIHPGRGTGKGASRRIPVDVARRITSQVLERNPGLKIAVALGPEEADLMPEFQNNLESRQVILTGHSLPVTLAIISEALGLIASDSGLGHVASAVRVPTVTLFGPSLPSETSPYGPVASIATRKIKLECQPCWGTPLYGNCPYNARCMHELPEDQVVSAVSVWASQSPIDL
jgi:ADP-heptose:LPS heptosyltransferase